MLRLIVALLLTSVITCRSQSLLEFHENFAEKSHLNQPVIHELSHQNGYVRLRLIHWILREMAHLTVEMRSITNNTWAAIQSHERLNDDCLPYVQDLFEYYVEIGALDIMYLAYDMNYYMEFDDEYRFVPLRRTINLENFRILSVTLETLSRISLVNDPGEVFRKLQEETIRFEQLWRMYRIALQQEIRDIWFMEVLVKSEMQWWTTFAVYWHNLLMQDAINSVNYFC